MFKFTSPVVTTIVLSLLTIGGNCANHFNGYGASNSIGGNGGYVCRNQDQWNQVADDASSLGIKVLRITGFDCNALELASSAAARRGMQVMAGIWVNGNMAQGQVGINNDVQTFRAAYAKYGPTRYAGLTVGNEVQDSAANIMTKVFDVRGYLRSVGVSTPVSTVHIWGTIRQSPILCGADFVAANAHPFYDPPSTHNSAGAFLSNTVVPALRGACPGKEIIITEAGWPTRGSPVGAGVPSIDNARTALRNINCVAANVKIYLFEYDDQLWKGNDVERSFGTWGKIQGFIDSC